jgi:hypothetical protein
LCKYFLFETIHYSYQYMYALVESPHFSLLSRMSFRLLYLMRIQNDTGAFIFVIAMLLSRVRVQSQQHPPVFSLQLNLPSPSLKESGARSSVGFVSSFSISVSERSLWAHIILLYIVYCEFSYFKFTVAISRSPFVGKTIHIK